MAIANHNLLSNHKTSPSIFSDLQSLNGIRKQAQQDSDGAIKAAAKEFEAFFMNMMLKSMRQAGEVMGGDSMLSSSQEKMFIGMLDEQMSVELSQKGNLGIADLMVRNLLGDQLEDQDKVNDYSHIKASLDITPISQNDLDEMKEVPKLVKAIKEEFKRDVIEPTRPSLEMISEQISSEKSEKKSLFDSATEFVSRLMPVAKSVSEKIGLDPRLLLAQAALETGWGKFVIHDKKGQASHNLFGIKSNNGWNGAAVSIDTLEVENGEFVKKKESFRMYQSFEESFDDFINFIESNPRYQSAIESANDAKSFIHSLQSAGYATDPNYAKKIINILDREPLTNLKNSELTSGN